VLGTRVTVSTTGPGELGKTFYMPCGS